MVPMLTCGLVRSNLALATGSSSGLSCRYPGRWISTGGSTGLVSYVTGCSEEQRPRSLALALLDDLVGDGLRDLRVAVELHRVHRAARRLGTQVTDVAEHLRQGDIGPDDL